MGRGRLSDSTSRRRSEYVSTHSSDGANAPSPRATIRRHPERAVEDAAEITRILEMGFVAHVGFVHAGQPYVIPMTYHFDAAYPRQLYLHGAHASRLLKHLATGAVVCVEIMLLDGLVFSRTAQYHSMNYRSVAVFARGRRVRGAKAQRTLMEAMIARYHPGRMAGRDYEAIPDADLKATAFIALEIEEWSAKVRAGGPTGPRDNDPNALGTAGVVALVSR